MRDQENRVTEGSVTRLFLAYAVPSLIGIVSITTASVVDGLFVGRYVGADALAAVTLCIPFFTLVFGLTLMLVVGGCVEAGVSLGEQNVDRASGVYSKILCSVGILGLILLACVHFGQGLLYNILGGYGEVYLYLGSYLDILVYALMVQMLGMACYYFLRVSGRPDLGTVALVTGALLNILLDYIFIKVLEYGIAGAAWATLISQSVQLSMLIVFLWKKQTRLRWGIRLGEWSLVPRCIRNGFSEFVNEVSVGVVIFIINYLMLNRHGVEGVAAFSVVNYLLFISVMVTFGLADGVPPIVGENYGARRLDRVGKIMRLSFFTVALTGGVMAVLALCLGAEISSLFLEGQGGGALALTQRILWLIWPVFLLHGLNILISLYLTGIRKALSSSLIALSRSLVLPVVLLLLIYHYLPNFPFMVALPIAEAFTLALAVALFLRNRPNQDALDGGVA